MRTILLAGSASLAVNLLILLALIPIAIGFQFLIIAQIAFWTFFAATGATLTMIVVQKYAYYPKSVFVALAFIIFFLSLIPIYLHAGILHDFSASLLLTAVNALRAMHIADSLIISAFAIRLFQPQTATVLV